MKNSNHQENSIEKIMETLKTISSDKLLDIATGRGQFIHFLTQGLQNYKEIIGIDSNSNGKKGFEEIWQNKNIIFQEMDAYNLTFEEGAFDLTSISYSLHHFENIGKVLEEMKRVLKKDGYFIINEMHSGSDQSSSQESHVKLHSWWSKIDRANNVTHFEPFTPDKIQKIIDKSNLEEILLQEYSYPMENVFDDKIISHLQRSVDVYLNRIPENHPQKNEWIEEAKNIHEHIQKFGYSPAKCLFFIGKKK